MPRMNLVLGIRPYSPKYEILNQLLDTPVDIDAPDLSSFIMTRMLNRFQGRDRMWPREEERTDVDAGH